MDLEGECAGFFLGENKDKLNLIEKRRAFAATTRLWKISSQHCTRFFPTWFPPPSLSYWLQEPAIIPNSSSPLKSTVSPLKPRQELRNRWRKMRQIKCWTFYLVKGEIYKLENWIIYFNITQFSQKFRILAQSFCSSASVKNIKIPGMNLEALVHYLGGDISNISKFHDKP